jgi:glycerol uptake facilitator-like aquaporin
LAFIVYLFGPVSGAHVNPAVSVAVYFQKKINAKQLGGYIAAQLAGAALALIIYKLLKGEAGSDVQVKIMQFSDAGRYMLGELLSSIIFVFGVMAVVRGVVSKSLSGFFVGMSLCMATLITIFTFLLSSGGAVPPSFNPAVAFSAGVLDMGYVGVLTYMVVPLIGGLIASLLAHAVYGCTLCGTCDTDNSSGVCASTCSCETCMKSLLGLFGLSKSNQTASVSTSNKTSETTKDEEVGAEIKSNSDTSNHIA